MVLNTYVASIQGLMSLSVILASVCNTLFATFLGFLIAMYFLFAYIQIFKTRGVIGILKIIAVIWTSQLLQVMVVVLGLGLGLYFLWNPIPG